MRPHYSLVTPPASEPVTSDQASEHLRVDSSDDIAYIEALISVAREFVDSLTGRVSGESAWKLVGPDWETIAGDFSDDAVWRARRPGQQINVIPIFRSPLVSVQSISYYAAGATVLTAIDPADYLVITDTEPGMVKLTSSLPALADRPDAIQIAFTAGYSSPELVPTLLRHAVKMLVSHLYENRLPVAFASCQNIPFTLENFILQLKLGGWVA